MNTKKKKKKKVENQPGKSSPRPASRDFIEKKQSTALYANERPR